MIDDDGLIDLPRPTIEELEKAAKDILGEAGQAPLGDDGAKIFKGMNGVFLQAAGEAVGEWIGGAPPELQDRLLAEAAALRRAAKETKREAALDPSKNEFIKIGD